MSCYLEWPLHHRYHAAPGIQELHQHSQAVTGVVVLVLARLHKQRHLVHERPVFLGAMGFINEIELLHIRRMGGNWLIIWNDAHTKEKVYDLFSLSG